MGASLLALLKSIYYTTLWTVKSWGNTRWSLPYLCRHLPTFFIRHLFLWSFSACLFCDLEILGLNNSVIVGNNSEYLANLTNWIKPRRSERDWKLCWRASRDGWDNSRFHSLCEEKGPTVTIVKVGKYIFGGYTSLSWGTYHSLL